MHVHFDYPIFLLFFNMKYCTVPSLCSAYLKSASPLIFWD